MKLPRLQRIDRGPSSPVSPPGTGRVHPSEIRFSPNWAIHSLSTTMFGGRALIRDFEQQYIRQMLLNSDRAEVRNNAADPVGVDNCDAYVTTGIHRTPASQNPTVISAGDHVTVQLGYQDYKRAGSGCNNHVTCHVSTARDGDNRFISECFAPNEAATKKRMAKSASRSGGGASSSAKVGVV